MINNSDFNFSKDEIILLFWIKYWALEKVIQNYRIDKISSLVTSKEGALKKENENKSLQYQWLDEWHQKTADLLKIDKKIEYSELNIKIQEFSFSKAKLAATITDCCTFTPFHPLEDKNKKYKNIKFDKIEFLTKLSLIFKKNKSEMLLCRTTFENSIKNISKDISGSSNILIWTSIAAVIAIMLAPTLAGHLGSALFALHGAAATSAGLAFLGGGALAAGGFGMAGGTFAIMVGGSIIGYSLGNNAYKAGVKKLSNEEILISCAKLISFLTIYDITDKAIIREFCNSSRLLQMDFEEDVDEYFLSKSKSEINKRKSKELKQKPAILVSFRKHIRAVEG